MSNAQICPVCRGRGYVSPTFYYSDIPNYTVSNLPQVCRSCGGTGYIVVQDFNCFAQIQSCVSCKYRSTEIYSSIPLKIWCKYCEQYRNINDVCASYEYEKEEE